jgi:hypothetical protein
LFNFGIAIIPVNDIPIGLDTTYVTPAGQSISGQLSVIDPDDSVFVFLDITSPANGSISNWDSLGAFTYNSNIGFNGLDSIWYTVSDQNGALDTATVIFDVQNLPPVALTGFSETTENNPLTDTLEGFDPNQDPFTFAINTQGSKGVATIVNANTGEFSYQPNPGAIGSDFFLFEANDGSATSAADTFFITIRPNVDPGDILVGNREILLLIDPVTFEQAPVSRDSFLTAIQGVAYEPSGTIVVVDEQSGIVRIDPIDGSQSILTPDSFFSAGPPGPIGIDVNDNGDIYVADAGVGVFHINPLNGDTTLISSGDSMTVPVGLDIASNGDLLIADAGAFAMGTSRIITVDPLTGAQSVISSGDSLAICIGIAEDIDGSILVSDAKGFIGGQDLILRIDSNNGNQTVLSNSGLLLGASDLDVQKNDGRIYIVSQDTSLVLELDRTNNNLSVIAQGGFLDRPFSITTVQVPNTAPSLVISIPDTSVLAGNSFVFALDPGTFVDPNPLDVLTYSAALTGGGNLPAWLNFDDQTITFTGTPAVSDTGVISVEVECSDNVNPPVQDDFNILIFTTVGLNDQVIASIMVFPVPAKDFINISSNQISGNYVIEILDLKGNMVQRVEGQNKEFLEERVNISGLSSGSYMLKIHNENYLINRKIIID